MNKMIKKYEPKEIEKRNPSSIEFVGNAIEKKKEEDLGSFNFFIDRKDIIEFKVNGMVQNSFKALHSFDSGRGIGNLKVFSKDAYLLESLLNNIKRFKTFEMRYCPDKPRALTAYKWVTLLFPVRAGEYSYKEVGFPQARSVKEGEEFKPLEL